MRDTPVSTTSPCDHAMVSIPISFAAEHNQENTAAITLHVPQGRETSESISWLRNQKPEVVAQVLDTAPGLYRLSLSASSNPPKESDLYYTVDQLRIAHMQRESDLDKAFMERKREYESSAAAEIAELQEHWNNTLKAERQALAQVCAQHSQECVQHAEEARALRSSIAAEVEALVAARQRELTQQYDLCRESGEAAWLSREAANKASVDFLQRRLEAKDCELLAKDSQVSELHAEMHKMLQEKEAEYHADLRRKDAQLEAKDAEFSDYFSAIRRLTGNTSTVGKIGEDYVMNVHAALKLGSLMSETHSKAPGRGDATWTYDEIGLVALVEDKCGFTDGAVLHPDKDIGKFERDVKCAIEQGRINAAVFISLEKRIPGRAWISVDLKLGVPTVWAGRAADEDISAQSLVRLAFETMAQVFTVMNTSGSQTTDAIIQDITNHVTSELDYLESLKKANDANIQQIQTFIRRMNDMAKLIDRRTSDITLLRNRHPALLQRSEIERPGAPIPGDPEQLIDWVQSQNGLHAQEKWREYYNARTTKRKPAKPDDLTLNPQTRHDIHRDPALWHLLEQTMKSQNMQYRSQNRKTRPHLGKGSSKAAEHNQENPAANSGDRIGAAARMLPSAEPQSGDP